MDRTIRGPAITGNTRTATIVLTKTKKSRGDHFRFDSVFIKKSNQTEIFFFWKKKPKPGQTDRFQFGSVRFFRAKTGSNRFFRFWLGFLGFGSVFSGFGSVFSGLVRFWLGLARFFQFFVGFGSVRFGFMFIKPKPNRTGRFFQKFNRFNRLFFSVWFFRLFFFRFSLFNRFSGFFAHP